MTIPAQATSDDRAKWAATRREDAVLRQDAADRRLDWADYVGWADTDQDRAAAAKDLEEDERDRVADRLDQTAQQWQA